MADGINTPAIEKRARLPVKRKVSKSRPRSAAVGKPSPQPLIDTSDRLAHLVKDAGKSLARALQIRLAERSIAYGHWTFLRILWKHDGVSQTELSRLAGVMTPSTFAAVTSMEKLGYLVRRQKPGNKKKVHISLTPLGKALERELVPLAIEVNNIAIADMTERQIAEFRNALINIIEKLGDESEPRHRRP
jgi:DNA-binding MarR family transcriptional regulator